jgi:hypothetical protein
MCNPTRYRKATKTSTKRDHTDTGCEEMTDVWCGVSCLFCGGVVCRGVQIRSDSIQSELVHTSSRMYVLFNRLLLLIRIIYSNRTTVLQPKEQ